MPGSFALSPLQLFFALCVIALARVILSLRPLVTASGGRTKSIAREYLDQFIIAGGAALLLITFVGRPYFIPSGSMEPTLQIHDVLLVNKLDYRLHAPRRGDIAVFRPAVPSPDDFIKRVIAVPGDSLAIHRGIVYVDGHATAEPYIAQKPDYDLEIKNYGIYVDGARVASSQANIPQPTAWSAPNRIPANCFFMMGDNRNDSEDSHIWGFAQAAGAFATGPRAGQDAHMTGRAFVIFWPLNRIRLLGR